MSSFRRNCAAVATVAALVLGLGSGCTSRSALRIPSTTGAAITPTPSTPAPTTTQAPATTTTTTSATTISPTTTTIPPTTTTTIPLITEGAIVKVANASTVSGAAASLTEQLAAFHFAVGDATNAAGPDERLDVSKVYYLPGSEAVAGQIAALMGDVAVVPMPTPAWIREGTAGLKDATVLVMLGTDLAGKKALPGLRGRRPG